MVFDAPRRAMKRANNLSPEAPAIIDCFGMLCDTPEQMTVRGFCVNLRDTCRGACCGAAALADTTLDAGRIEKIILVITVNE
jgi:hypothetical protein